MEYLKIEDYFITDRYKNVFNHFLLRLYNSNYYPNNLPMAKEHKH